MHKGTQIQKEALLYLNHVIDPHKLIVGDFNRQVIQKINRELLELTDVRNIELTDIYTKFYPNRKDYTFLSVSNGTLSKIDHVLRPKS